MKTKTILLLFVAILTATSCTQKPVIVNNDALVDSLLAVTSDLWNSGNPETVLSMYSDDAIFILNGDIYSGRDSMLTLFKNVVPGMKNTKTLRGTYAVVNDLITATGMYTFDWLGADQKIYPIRGSSTIYWMKTVDNKWKVVMQLNQHADVVNK